MEKPIKLERKTYLSVIENSVGTKLFKNFFIKKDDNEVDAMQNGQLSCAFFVSGILSMFNLILSIHGTVKNTVEDLEKSNWVKVDEPKPGSVIVWEEINFGNGDVHKHIGFYIGNNNAISNSYLKGIPVKHNWTFEGKRKIEAIYTLNNLSDNNYSKMITTK